MINIKQLKQFKIIRYISYPIIAYRRAKASDLSKASLEKYNSFMSKIKSGNVVVEFSDFQGIFEMNIHSSLVSRIFMYGEYEQDLTKLVGKYLNKDKDVIDVGANIGLFTILLSKSINHNRKVLAIEPTPNALKFLNNNLKINNCESNVTVYQGCASDKFGELELNTIEGLEEYSSLGKMVHSYVNGIKSNLIIVNGETIDNLVKANAIVPGFIKMDIEGAELKALKGAQQTLKDYKPIILSEVSENLFKNQGSSCRDFFDFLKSFGYTIYDADTMKPVNNSMEGTILAIHS